MIAYRVWDRTTRCFHWVNLLCVLALAAFGVAILNAKTVGVSPDGKLLLKTLHVYAGYVFVINLSWRFLWAFFGNRHARWRSILPFGRGYFDRLRDYLRGFVRGSPPVYLGHNPLARMMVTCLLLLLAIQATTGLVLAGTDLYKPPFGGMIAEWVTGGDPDKLSLLEPGSKTHVDAAAYDAMRAFRSPIVTTHLYIFYALMVAVLLHVIGVVATELREKRGLISAMVTGEKRLEAPPIDAESTKEEL